MFRAKILHIFRDIRLYTTACGMLYPIRCRWVMKDHQIIKRQLIGYNIPQAVVFSLMLLKMGKIVARNMSR